MMQTSPIYELQEIIASKDAEIERLVKLIKDFHKSKILLMALDGNTGEEHEGEMEAITNLWNRIKQVYRDYPKVSGPAAERTGR